MDEYGYGQINVSGNIVKAPRVAFFLRNGIWPMNACHSCDNPRCCNPSHIYNGNPKTNAQDREKRNRGRQCFGESHGGAMLTEVAVSAIRSEYKTGEFSMAGLAAKHGVSFSTLQRVITRTNWKHVK